MDNYDLSFSDSWSVENDVLSGEGVSHNFRDYTPEFTTHQIFQSRDDMVAWVRTVGKDNGIVIVIKKSASLIGASCQSAFLVVKEVETGVMWGVRVECGIHNHETAEYFDGHEYPSRLTPEEKEIVRDMADNTVPREILSVLKKKNPLNTTCAQSIYNLKYTDNIAELDGLNPTQFVLNQLIQKRYLHEYRTNSCTNEITDIVWVHPQSLDLFVNFPSVLVIDATYKTNEYRLPLLEVVGITSTMCTYSLMFAHLTNERIENLTWALSTLKKWMLGRGALLPSVFVTDRDLALLSAIEACFPSARHILCIWHINQCIIKHCRGILGPSFNDFNMSWHSLINSTTEASFNQKWNAMCDDYKQHPQLLQYLFNTWLMPYRDRFVAAWINTCMHLGSNSSQRAESAHARLKLYLGGTMSSLQQAFKKIDKMLKNQFGDIRRSFQRSINIPRHWQIHDELFQQVRTRISLEAMELIDVQLQCAEDASYLQFQLCDCTIKITHGLPCRHDLAYYRWYSMPIPIQSIHDHWTKLSMRAPIVNDDGERPDRTYEVVDRLRGMDQSTREHMIDRIIDMTDPSQSTVRGPAYNTAHRGRPTGREEQSGRRIPSFTEISTSSSRIESGRRGRGDGVRKTQANCDEFSVPSIRIDYIQHLPRAYQHYISHINDVRGDGHCGFRAIAAHIGYGEDRWAQVRRDLINEIEQNMDLYNALYPEIGWADYLIRSLNYFEDSAPDEYWMDAMSMGVVIASAYNLVLHTFDALPSSCFTHFPLRSPPVPAQERIEIAIARVGNNHFPTSTFRARLDATLGGCIVEYTRFRSDGTVLVGFGKLIFTCIQHSPVYANTP
ncbi:protein FAR1-RELATED SEQUENCE 5-like [Rhododendron vialii]|uniref:protein FAR1-RELATED SEQUENCE 5-like n=1 Tax=Rhododendron vialii TaxID=182163 RepID=UPI00265E23A3|nr:protein FAR1-RELATED SEQUENCE 5-like [Rhododendron vialii]